MSNVKYIRVRSKIAFIEKSKMATPKTLEEIKRALTSLELTMTSKEIIDGIKETYEERDNAKTINNKI